MICMANSFFRDGFRFFEDLKDDMLVQGQISYDSLALSVHLTELKKITQLADPHPAILLLPVWKDCSLTPSSRQTSLCFTAGIHNPVEFPVTLDPIPDRTLKQRIEFHVLYRRPDPHEYRCIRAALPSVDVHATEDLSLIQ